MFFIWLLVFTGSCKKTDNFYLEDTTPEAPFGIETTDTSTILLRTERHIYGGQNLEKNLLGTFTDPVFGRTTANIYTQVLLDDINPRFTPTSKFNSFTLYLRVDKNTSTGNFADVQKWSVYELSNGIEAGREYLTDTVLPVLANAVGSYNGPLNDTLLQISLTEDFAKKFFTANKNNFNDRSAFSNFMKGLAILPDSTGINGNGAVAAVNINHAASRLVLRFDDTLSFTMNFRNGQHVNAFTHNYNGTPAGSALNANHFPDRAYIQAMAGLRLHVQLPYMKNLAGGKHLAIRKAELIFTRIDSTGAVNGSKHPERITFSGRRENGTNVTGASHADYNAADKTYRLLLTAYIQELLIAYEKGNDLNTYGLNGFIAPETGLPTRAIIDAGPNSSQRPKLVLTYTKLD